MTNRNINLESRQRYFWLLLCTLVVMIGSYFYFVHQSIAVVVDQEAIKRRLNETSAVNARLESTYIRASSKITMELASERGFTDPTFDSSFAYLDRAERLALGGVSNER